MITINPESELPLYQQIYEQLKNHIVTGQLKAGDKLASTRHLAASLAVGRNTVENAYMQLVSEGYVESRQGSGFIVQHIMEGTTIGLGALGKQRSVRQKPPVSEPQTSESLWQKEDFWQWLQKAPPIEYNFEYGHLSTLHFPINLWKKVSAKAMATLTAEEMAMYSDRKGELGLRQALRDFLLKSRGVDCGVEQILLCTGFENSLSLLSQLLRPDLTTIGLEEPGYTGAREIFRNNGFKVMPVSVDRDGLNVEELEASNLKAIYVTPSHQFPTGAVMPIQRRLQLLDWAKRTGGLIIEDDYDSELRYNSRPIPSISSVSDGEKVIYVGTLSKALSPSLRLSYMVLPKYLMQRYDDQFRMYQTPVSLVQQRIVRQFIEGGHWEHHLRRSCHANKKKHDLLVHAIQNHLGDQVTIHGKNAGIHLLVAANNGLTESELIQRAMGQGVLVYPVSLFWSDVNRYPGNMVLLGFGNMPENDIAEGVKRLAAAWL